MDKILISATTIIAFVLAGTQLIKTYTGADNKWLPVINLALGIGIGLAWSWSFDQPNLIYFIWGGAVAGLSAGGFYDLGASFVKRKDED
ncbi:phage holin family protein [Enterococcus sp. LJL99]